MGGVYTGLASTTAFYNLVVACDMPFLNPELLGYLVNLAPNYDAVVPVIDNIPQPLHAVYSKKCLVPMEQLLQQNKLKLRGVFSLVNTRYVTASETNRFDPEHLSFFNINTRADLTKAKALINEKG